MTAIPQGVVGQGAAAPALKPVSRRLTEPLRLVAGRARVLGFVRACVQLLVLAGAGWLVIVLALGTLRDIPVIVAVALALGAWAILILGALRFFGGGRVFRRESLSSSALRVDAAMPATQERISSAVELSQETDGRFRGSPELVACLIRQAEKDADKLDPNLVVSGSSVMRWFGLLLPVLAVWLVVLVVKTPLVMLGLQRTLKPWAAAPALPMATLHVEPGNQTVAQGEEVKILLTVNPAPTTAADGAQDATERATITRRFTTGSADQELTAEMERRGSHEFWSTVPNVEQSFSYRVASEGVQSPTYTVTVQPRPAVAKVEIGYEFPKYTGLAARQDKSRDGAIDAVVGTRVKITVEATQNLKRASLEIADNAPNSSIIDLLPVVGNGTAAGAARYAGELTVIKSTQYKIRLVNAQNLENKDNQPRPIMARMDAPPQISIVSPIGTLKVRPDDSVNIAYAATDDFGIAKIEALVQVDELPQRVVAIPLTQPETQQKITGKWPLSVSDLVRGIAGGADAKRISYQLRATDNCEPAAQTGLSARQILEIDKGVAPLAQRQDAEAVKVLADAIKKAAEELKQARQELDSVKKADAGKPLGESEKQAAADARQRIADARKNLSEAADKAKDTRLAEPAHEAREIAADPLGHAEEKAADTQLEADKAAARNQSAAESQRNIDEAHRRLAALAQNLGEKAKDQPLAQAVEQIAAQQKQLADAMEKNPGDPKLKEQQRQLQERVEKLIKENPELQKPAADASQARRDALVQKIRQLEQTQQPLQDTLKNQAQPGTQAMRDAAALQDQTKQLAQQIEQSKNDHDPPTRPSDPANQEASRLADELKRESQKLGQTAEAKSAAQEAVKAADAARREAAKGNAEAAQQQLTQGSQKLAEAANAAQRSKSEAAEAKERTAAAARQQEELAGKIEQARQDAQALQEQTKGAAPDLSEHAGKAEEALEQAAQAQRAAAKDAPKSDPQQAAAAQEQSADKLATAEEDLTGQPSASRRRQPAQQVATGGQKPPSESPQSGDNNSASPAAPQEGAAQQQPNKSDDTPGTSQGSKPGQQANSGQKSGTGPGQRSGQATGGSSGTGQSGGQSGAGQGQSATSGAGAGQAAGAATGSGSGQTSSRGQSATGGQASAGGSSTASGQGSTGGQSGSSSAASPGGNGSPGGQPGSTQSGAGQTASGAESQGAGSPDGRGNGQGLAQKIQSARQAQSQAANGEPGAARRAADQLSQASQQMTGSQISSPGAGQGSGASGQTAQSAGGNSPGAGSGSGQSASGGTGSPQPGGTGSGGKPGTNGPGGAAGNGITLTQGPHAPPPEPPQAVKDIGLSPSDWARLPANMQEQLLHSAQESGPPSYHEMIKNYYSRIARLQTDGSEK